MKHDATFASPASQPNCVRLLGRDEIFGKEAVQPWGIPAPAAQRGFRRIRVWRPNRRVRRLAAAGRRARGRSGRRAAGIRIAAAIFAVSARGAGTFFGWLLPLRANPSATSPYVGVRCIIFWFSYAESDGFPIHPKERLVCEPPTVCSSSLINTWIEFRG